MDKKEHLIDQHILEYESRLKHIDELLTQVDLVSKNANEELEQVSNLQKIKLERNGLEDYIRHLKEISIDNWEKDEISSAGPMAVWDVLAQQLEKLIQAISKHNKQSK